MYTAKQVEILRLVQGGMSIAEAGAQLGLQYKTAMQLIYRYRWANNLSPAEFWRMLPMMKLPMSVITERKYNGIRLRKRDGIFQVFIRHNKEEYFVGTSLTKDAALKKRQAALANVEKIVSAAQRRKERHKYIYQRSGTYFVRPWDAKQKVGVYLGSRHTLEDALALRDEYLNGTATQPNNRNRKHSHPPSPPLA